MYNAIGMIELSSIAKGIYATDLMIKAADVNIATATSICPGKYIAIIEGSVGAVESSIKIGETAAGEYLVDSFIIPNVHESIFPAISGTTDPGDPAALGIMESFSVASMILAADAALKAASVEALELRIGSGLGGKAFFTFTGDVAAVEAAAEAGTTVAMEKRLMVDVEVIPSPSKRLWDVLY